MRVIQMEDASFSNKYTLIFSSIQNDDSSVRFINQTSGEEETVGVSIDDHEFQHRTQREFPSIVADLIDIAVAIHTTDRLTQQPLDDKQTCIHIILPVRNPSFLNKASIVEKLCKLLYWTTASRWTFEFQTRQDEGRDVERQPLLLSTRPHVDEIALWSGGLDALAGLCTRLQQNNGRNFMLFGTGSSDNVYARQRSVFECALTAFPSQLSLCRVPLRFSNSTEHIKNKFSRARGVVFTLLGSACSYLMGRKKLHLYENGVGAINLPYRKSALGLDHSRSVHPLTLLQVSETVSTIFTEDFEVENPFLFWTKGEMCQALTDELGKTLILATTSCDSPHRKKYVQCGYCSSCLLRRQALAAAGIDDPSRYVVPHGESPAGDTGLYLRHMLTQVSTIKELLGAENDFSSQWQAFTRRFPELDSISDRIEATGTKEGSSTKKKLLRLYQTYVSEWDAVESQISSNMLSPIEDKHLQSSLLTPAK